MFIAVALSIGLAALGTGIGQGNAVNGAMQAIGRNPEAQGKVQGTLILGLAFIESLAIYALVISLMLQGKLGQ
jgi:F-type H+-transporting ATPase subunit c